MSLLDIVMSDLFSKTFTNNNYTANEKKGLQRDDAVKKLMQINFFLYRILIMQRKDHHL